ncbi:MAG: hypothetical protein II337_07670 [Clostridia bacterium]|nr:hypothetical protein [Clostridia bacterium]
MGVHLGFRKTLLKIGKWRFGIGYSMHGATGFFVLCIYAMLNLMWYSILACLWMTYGVIWLFFVLPIKIIVKICKRKKAPKKVNTVSSR